MKTLILLLTLFTSNTDNMPRAYSIHQILTTKFETIKWSAEFEQAFGNPEASGVWFVWGNSGNSKTRFMIQLAVELSQYRKVFYNSLEEGKSLTMQTTLRAAGLDGKNKNLLIGKEPIEEMDERLSKPKAPRVAIIDSINYANINFKEFRELTERHPKVLFIVSSQARGKLPATRVGESILYDADLKIHIEGYRATSNGRYNPGGVFDIWEQGALNYWGNTNKNN